MVLEIAKKKLNSNLIKASLQTLKINNYQQIIRLLAPKTSRTIPQSNLSNSNSTAASHTLQPRVSRLMDGGGALNGELQKSDKNPFNQESNKAIISLTSKPQAPCEEDFPINDLPAIKTKGAFTIDTSTLRLPPHRHDDSHRKVEGSSHFLPNISPSEPSHIQEVRLPFFT